MPDDSGYKFLADLWHRAPTKYLLQPNFGNVKKADLLLELLIGFNSASKNF